MYLQDVECGHGWINLTQDRDKWRGGGRL
jgi:hypothetical protein